MATIVSEGNLHASDTNTALGVAHRRLFYLHDLPEYKVHHDDTDVRGWKVVLDSGQSIGTIDSLIVDTSAERVRYLEVNTDREFMDGYRTKSNYLDQDTGAHYGTDVDELLTVPIGIAEIDHNLKQVVLRGFTADYFGNAPRYRRGSTFGPRYEVESLDYYDNNYAHQDESETPFSREAFRDFDEGMFQGHHDRFYQHRMFDRGSFYDRHDEAISSKGL